MHEFDEESSEGIGEEGYNPAEREKADQIYKSRYFYPLLVENHDEQKEHWTRVAWAALPRFREQQSIRLRDIQRRLGEIRQTNYLVKSHYRSMEKKEAWDYLMQIRADVRRNATDFCPDVVQKIDQQNEERKLEARLNL